MLELNFHPLFDHKDFLPVGNIITCVVSHSDWVDPEFYGCEFFIWLITFSSMIIMINMVVVMIVMQNLTFALHYGGVWCA